MNNFYFAYGYDVNSQTADRLYRHIEGVFERYDFEKNEWIPAPEQACIFIGEDTMYDEIAEEQVQNLIDA